jgi:hypothetical protein
VPDVLALDDRSREAWLDLHGYATDTALWLARDVIETAWERGCRRVVIVHGAKHVETPGASGRTGRGHTKWALREALRRGEFRRFARAPGSGDSETRVLGDRIQLSLKPNPSPDSGAAWPAPPNREYSD